VPQKNLLLAATEGRVESEGWRVRKDGSRFWAHVVVDRIVDDNGELVGFAKITRDVTEQRDAARELDRAREALFQSQKTEAIGKLTGGVAHDFNNLLMVIQSCLDMVDLKLPHDSQLRKLVQNAQSAVQRGSALTQRMLAFARKQELRVAPVDVAGGEHDRASTPFARPAGPYQHDVSGRLESSEDRCESVGAGIDEPGRECTRRHA
jgi:signal transduction histidine kinase